MNFFEQIEKHLSGMNLKISLTKKGDKITAGVFPEHQNSDISAKLKPLLITGTAQELDEGFLQQLTPVIETTAGLITNIEGYQTELKELEAEAKKKIEEKRSAASTTTTKPKAESKPKPKAKAEKKSTDKKSAAQRAAETRRANQEKKKTQQASTPPTAPEAKNTSTEHTEDTPASESVETTTPQAAPDNAPTIEQKSIF